MNITLVTIDYPPEIRSVATMAKELAEELARRGHTVTVLTAWPGYNLPKDANAYSGSPDAQEGMVRVIRVRTLPLHKVHYAVRGLAQVLLRFLFIRAWMKFAHEAMDVVIVYSPPLSLSKIGAWMKRRYQARFLLNVQDVFPQNAIDLGILRNGLLIRYFEAVERKAYRTADRITTCTKAARRFLVETKGVPSGKVISLYNWIDTHFYQTAPFLGFRIRYRLENKFVFIFAGVLGPSQGLNFIVEIARRIQDLSDVCFLFVGDGTEKSKLQSMVLDHHLTNVQFEDFISQKEYPSLLREVDVGLMVLEKDCKTPTIPGKFFGFAAASLPILAFLNPESEGHRIITEAGCGYAAVSDDVEEGERLVRMIYVQRAMARTMGERGYHYVREHFSKKSCIDGIEKLLTSLVTSI